MLLPPAYRGGWVRCNRRVECMTEVDPNNEATFHVCVIPSDLRATAVPKQAILDDLQRNNYRDEEMFGIKLALEEALTNAVKHGNQSDQAKKIIVRYAITEHKAVIVVRDEGPGFAPDQIPDPTQPDRLPLPSGRGIMLMRAYMDVVEYRDQGREVYFVKHRT